MKVFCSKIVAGELAGCPNFSLAPSEGAEELSLESAFHYGAFQFEGWYAATPEVEAKFNLIRENLWGASHLEAAISEAAAPIARLKV